MTTTQNPHQGQPIRAAGVPLSQAKVAMVMLHGRGGTAESILTLADELKQPGFAYLAPQAAGNTWYPQSFLMPIANNEPGLSSALATITSLLAQIAAAGIAPEQTMLLGFSQGACLGLEFAARNARRYGGVIGLSGGLIGPDGTPRDYAGSLGDTPVFLGCSDVDAHVPKVRVEHSADVLRRLGGAVDLRIYPGMGHTVSQGEIDAVRVIMSSLGG